MNGDGSGTIWVVFGALYIFGFIYNWLVGWMERNGYAEGYTAMLVVSGTVATLVGVAVIDWWAAALTLGAFVCSGFWMVVGSWWRHVQRRKRGQELQRQEVSADDETARVAE